jgi:hypothetical protein
MDGVSTDSLCGYDNPIDREVGIGRRPATEGHGLVRFSHVRRVAILVRIDGYRRDSHLPACPEDAPGDLATIRDQQPPDNRHRGLR